MSNNKLPKEIYLLGQDLEFMVEDGKKDLYHIDASLSDILSNQKVYLLKQSVDERINALEDIIVQNNADNRRREQQLEQTIREKDKEIEILKMGLNIGILNIKNSQKK